MDTNDLKVQFDKLKEPLSPEDIEWRIQGKGNSQNKGLVLPYLTNRAVMNRLDEVFGPWGWKNEFKEGPIGGVMCGISVKIDGEWVTKWDGADKTDVEAIKGGYSDAQKRTAVEWGIGRYLYELPKYFITLTQNGNYWNIPEENIPHLPSWALPEGFKYGAATKVNTVGTPMTTGTDNKPAPKPADKKQEPATAKAPVENKPEGPKPVDPAVMERAKQYIVPATVPLAGRTLGEAMNDAQFGKPILSFLAGVSANKAKVMFTPKDDAEKALSKAASYLLQYGYPETTAA